MLKTNDLSWMRRLSRRPFCVSVEGINYASAVGPDFTVVVATGSASPFETLSLMSLDGENYARDIVNRAHCQTHEAFDLKRLKVWALGITRKANGWCTGCAGGGWTMVGLPCLSCPTKHWPALGEVAGVLVDCSMLHRMLECIDDDGPVMVGESGHMLILTGINWRIAIQVRERQHTRKSPIFVSVKRQVGSAYVRVPSVRQEIWSVAPRDLPAC